MHLTHHTQVSLTPRSRSGLTMPALLLAALVALLSLAGSPAAHADAVPLSVTDQAVHDKLTLRSLMTDLGPDLAGLVTDPTTGAVIWSQTPLEVQLPASNAKLITAVDALTTFGPTKRFSTQVVTGSAPGRIVLVGGGDPSLTSRQLGAMARAVAAAQLAAGISAVRLLVDDSLFPAPTSAVGWRWSYSREDVSPVRALVVDQHHSIDTTLDAGKVFARRLARYGLTVTGIGRTKHLPTATVIAESQGTDLATIVTRMLQLSDNDVAEALHRLVALATGLPPTWEGAALAQTAVLAKLGITLAGRLYDGSGLSRADRLTPTDLLTVLGRSFDAAHPELAGLQQGALPLAGVSGTLGPRYLRYQTGVAKCAAGLVQAKTGSLSGAIALTGFARHVDGTVKMFSFLLNGVPSTLRTRRAVDKLAATVTGCW